MISLRKRLVMAATVWIAVGVVLLGVSIAAAFRKHVTRQFYDELASHLDELQRLAEISADGQVRLRGPLSDPNYDVPQSGYYWEIQRNGTILARSPSLQGPELRAPPDRPQDLGSHTHLINGPTGPLRIMDRLVWPDAAKPPIGFVIGADQRHLDSVLASFHATLAWSMAAFAAAMILAAAVLIFAALRPLATLSNRLARVRAGAERQLQGAFPSEVQPLVDELNGMIAASANLVQRARAQAGNLAHGIKTSLAVLTDEADRIEQKGLGGSAKLILEHCRRMQLQIDHQIARARAAALRAAPGVSASLPEVAGKVVSALGRLYEGRGLRIEQAIPPDVRLACDPQDLNEMLANVLDNACKHARSTVRLCISDASSPSVGEILVEDDGPGLPPEAWEVVFKTGERWDSREQGSGLGLAIVQELATLYGGSVSLDDSTLGGLKVRLPLPKIS
jgi:signal transduction histidine kinase